MDLGRWDWADVLKRLGNKLTTFTKKDFFKQEFR